MKLLIEKNFRDIEIKKDPNKKKYFLEGIFLQSNIRNKNGRIYPEEVMDHAVETYNNEFVKKNRAFGELNHPDNPSINLDRASHLITELKKSGSNYYGKARILTETPCGSIVKALMDEGCRLGISSRGLGSLQEDKIEQANVVQDDFFLVTAGDIVADPSAPNAFLESVMENAEWVNVGGKWVPKFAEQMKKRVKKTPNALLEKVALEEFKKFMKLLKNS